MFISNIGLWFSFLTVSLSGFGIRVMLASENELGSIASSLVVGESLRRFGVRSDLKVW